MPFSKGQQNFCAAATNKKEVQTWKVLHPNLPDQRSDTAS